MNENDKPRANESNEKRQAKLFSIAGGLSAREATKEQATDGLKILAYMMGIYNGELKTRKVPWALRHKLCASLQLEMMRGVDGE